jgi:hypothetical protein
VAASSSSNPASQFEDRSVHPTRNEARRDANFGGLLALAGEGSGGRVRRSARRPPWHRGGAFTVPEELDPPSRDEFRLPFGDDVAGVVHQLDGQPIRVVLERA